MTRHPWELEQHVRYQMATVARGRRVGRPPAGAALGAATGLARLRHRLGLRLIRVGERLAGHRVPAPIGLGSGPPASIGRAGS